MINVLLVEDQYIVRKGLKALLETEPKITVIGETGDGLDAISLCEKLKPHVAIVDIGLPRMNGLEVTRQIRSAPKAPFVIILSAHEAEICVLRALKNGASGYVLKSAAEDLRYVVKRIAAGYNYLSSPFSEKAVEAYLEKAASTYDKDWKLTNREWEVFQYLADGCSLADIAVQLGISQRTVEVHRANLMSKLQLRSTKDIIKYAKLKGLLCPA